MYVCPQRSALSSVLSEGSEAVSSVTSGVSSVTSGGSESAHKFACRRDVAGVQLTEDEIGLPLSWRTLALRKDKLDQKLETAFGPFASLEAARCAVQRAENHAFGIYLSSMHPGPFRVGLAHGARRTLQCNTKKCPYRVVFELTKDEDEYYWYMHSSNTTHIAHPMSSREVDKLAIPLNRSVPEEYRTFAQSLVSCGVPGTLMYNVLNNMAQQQKVDVTWTKADVTALCRRGASAMRWDASGVMHMLQDRERSTGFTFRFAEDEEARLDLLFIEMPGASELIYAAGSRLCVMYDTTHGTNYHDCKLGLFTTVDRNLATSILAITLISGDECGEKFSWLFRQFIEVFKVRPNVMLTDSCTKI